MEYELYHHGILGMKWGIRRYQNKDGSLTSLGRNRYGRGEIPPKTEKYVYTDYTIDDYPNKKNKKVFDSKQVGKIIGSINKISKEAESITPKAKSINKGIHDLKRLDRKYDISKMSDDDLRKAINRMSLELNYKDLKNSDIGVGESKVNSWLNIAGGVTGIASSAALIGYIIWSIKNSK